jgi:hypothetical protein
MYENLLIHGSSEMEPKGEIRGGLKLDTEAAKIADEALDPPEAEGMHAGLAGAFDEAFHVVDEYRFLRLQTDFFEDAPVDPRVGFAGSDFMRREFPFEVAKKPEMSFDIVKMKRVRVRDQIKGITSPEPRKQLVHPGIFPEDIVPVMAKNCKMHGYPKSLASDPVELTGRNRAACIGLLEPGKEEALPDLAGRKPRRGRKPFRSLFDIVIDKHIAEIEDDGLYCSGF